MRSGFGCVTQRGIWAVGACFLGTHSVAGAAHPKPPSAPPSVFRLRKRKRPVRLVAVGDILLAGPMGAFMAKKGRNTPFAKMRPTLRAADIAFGNLECAVATVGEPIEKQFTFRARPVVALALAENGFDVVSLANNHTWDYGREALRQTVETVRATGVRPVGAGATKAAAHSAVVVERGGQRIAFLAYLGLTPALLKEDANAPSLAMADTNVIAAEVKAARRFADFVVVSLHAGAEGEPEPTPKQRRFATAAIEAGADMVIGHHPHVVQPLEMVKGKPVAWSLGNFVFSTAGRGSGALLEATLFPGGKIAARLRPLVLDGPTPRFPKPAKPR